MEDLKKKLQEEVHALEYELRNELPKEILKARAHGDLSEIAAEIEFKAAFVVGQGRIRVGIDEHADGEAFLALSGMHCPCRMVK